MAPKFLHQTTEKKIFSVFFYRATLLQSVQYVWQLSVTPLHRVKTAEVIDRSSDFSQRLAAGYEKRKKMEQRSDPHFQMPPVIDHQSISRSEISTGSRNDQRGSNTEMEHKNS